MKLVILSIIIALAVGVTFEEYMKQFNRTYTGEQLQKRKAVFNVNMELIAKANNENQNYTLGVTRWTDRFEHEIKDGMNMKFRRESMFKNRSKQPRKLRVAQNAQQSQYFVNTTQFDWRQKHAVTPVRQQGMCGACWAFATTATIESDFYYKTNVILDLSQQYVMQCIGGDNDCTGGYFEDAYIFLKRKGGMPLEVRYPYQGGAKRNSTQICETKNLIQFKKDQEGDIDFEISYYDDITNEQLQDVLLQSTVSTHFASTSKFAQYRTGIFSCNYTINESMINHGVQIVGFNSTGRYFIVKNSWGTKWGMDGYGYVSYDGDCGMKIRIYTFEQHTPIQIPLEAEQTVDLQYESLPTQNYEPLPTQSALPVESQIQITVFQNYLLLSILIIVFNIFII